ncbi:hypothetical protein V6N12_074748 [Hibiscus sabdariffa]|uniref:Uncharacterized protein n=1 Tax=Hibiscus sabdariffa TaxID=183260 RepID=A0ABR2D2P5_9ROSI
MKSLGNYAPTLYRSIYKCGIFGQNQYLHYPNTNMRSQNLMAKLKRSKGVAGGRPKAVEGCKRHPKHKQSPGVCSLCLAEKLSQLSFDSISRRPTITTTTTCSSSSSLSSYYSSSSSSPVGEEKGPLLLFVGKTSLTNTRSGAFASRDKKKNGGFLWKLLHHHTNNTTMVH